MGSSMLLFSPPGCRCTTLLCSPERVLPALQTLCWSLREVPALPVVFFYPWNCHVSFLFYSSLKQQHFQWCAALRDYLYSFECGWNLIHLDLWVFSLLPKMRKMASLLQPVPLPSTRESDELLGCEAGKSRGEQQILKLGRSFPSVSSILLPSGLRACILAMFALTL